MLLHHQKTGAPLELTLRPFRPQDAPQVIACIRDAYGDSYVKPFLYQEEEMIRMNDSGEMVFSVAETPEGKIVGITAYEESEEFPHMAEIACQVIQRSANGYGLALPLALHSMHLAEQQPFSCQFSRALGCHLISQKTLKAMGFTACGFLLHIFDKEKFLLRFPNGNYEKIPQAVAAKRQDKTDAGALWLPEELLPLAETMYNSLGVSHKPCQAEELDSYWGTELLSMQDDLHKNLTLRAVHSGQDFAKRLTEAIAPYAACPTQTVNLYLNLQDAGSRSAYEAARAQGFFPTGFLPCCSDGEYVILHNPLQVPVRLDDIPYIPEYAPFWELMRRQS